MRSYKRITLSLDKDVLKSLSDFSNERKISSLSGAAEIVLKKGLGIGRVQQAVILAGGKGERLKPITSEIPKPMIPLQGKPIVQHVIDLFRKFGVKEIIFAIGYKGDKIKEYFGDGHRFGVRIHYIEEKTPLGTAGPLKLAQKYIDGTFITCNADELKDIDLFDMCLEHKKNMAIATIALTTVEDPSAYGVARLQGDRILEFVEKPSKKKAPSKFINSGLYIMEPEIIDFIPNGFAMLEKDVFPKLAKQGKLFGYPFSGQWFDTGTMERYERAMKEWKGID